MTTFKYTLLLAATFVVSSTAAEQPLKQQPPNPTKLQSKISTLDAHEGIIVDVTIEPNAAMPVHQHPGDEFLYILSGTTELALENRAPLQLKAGDAYQIPAGTVHSPKAGAEGARAIVFRVHPSGEPVTVLLNE
jgi:quercetin dioxygenase-like cupin family protein